MLSVTEFLLCMGIILDKQLSWKPDIYVQTYKAVAHGVYDLKNWIYKAVIKPILFYEPSVLCRALEMATKRFKVLSILRPIVLLIPGAWCGYKDNLQNVPSVSPSRHN